MSGAGEDDAEKEYEPSERKLAQAREKGDIARSEDLQTSISYAGFLLALLMFGGWAIGVAGRAGMVFLDQPERIAQIFRQGATAQIAGLSVQMAAPLMLLLIGPAVLVIVYLVGTKSLVFAPSKLAFKLSRLSLVSNAGQKFGRSGLVEFLKRFAKMMAVSALLTAYLYGDVEDILMSARMQPGQIILLLAGHIVGFLKLILMIAIVFGLVDFLWQKSEFARRNRMTRKEMVDESKESEGDPHMKANRRRRAQEIATNRMLTDVPKADVIIVNPTHYAVALTWDRGKGNVPRCVAKGTDEIAARIRERAAEAGVPIRRDPPTARALFATVEIGRDIRPEHYAAVAAAIRFSDTMRKKARRR
ncbi:MAG: flagellar type III secretion system protein FlhB [Paracoccaceae bacterium]